MNKIAIITNHNNLRLPFKVSFESGENFLYKTIQSAVNDCEKNKIYYEFKLKKQSNKKEPIAPGVDLEIKLDGSGILYVEGNSPILITEDQVKKFTIPDKVASLKKKAELVGKENAGYEIISEKFIEDDKEDVGKVSVVLAKSTGNAPDKYVTWEHNEQSGYYWGHYFNDEEKARKDFLKRCEK